MTNPNQVDSAVEKYLKAREHYEDLEHALELAKTSKAYYESVLIDTMAENNLKSINHSSGRFTVKRSMFGSISKDVDKVEVLNILKTLPEFQHVVVSKEDFSVKTLGAFVKELEEKALEKWLEEKQLNPNVEDFNASMFLPKELVGKIATSQSVSITFTRSK